MNKTTVPTMALLSAILLPLAGCGGGGDTAKTPMEAIENFRRAILDKDADAMKACFHTTENTEKMVAAMADFMIAATEFEEAMVAEYGDDAAKDMKGGMKELKDENWVEKVTIEEKGDTAVARMEGKNQPMNLVKKDGAWYIDAAGMAGPTGGKKDLTAEDAEKAAGMMTTMGEAMKKVGKNIGTEGYTAEKINEEMGTAMMEAMMGSMGEKPKQP